MRNSPQSGHPAIANFSVPGIRSETMLHFLEARGVYVSSGSACARGEASHTLSAMGLAKRASTAPCACRFPPTAPRRMWTRFLAGVAEGVKPWRACAAEARRAHCRRKTERGSFA